MKRLVKMAMLCMVFAAYGSAYLPKASVRQIAASPLRHAELCWVENADGAEVYVGNAEGKALRATDPAALRGARIRRLKLGEYAVSASSGFTYDSVRDRYTITTTATNTIIITVPQTYNVTDFGYHVEDVPAQGELVSSSPSSAWMERNGNVAVITFVKGGAPLAYVDNISVYAKEFGDGEGFNDLTLTTFMLRDSMGVIDFANLRHWAAHLYDGNRGEHWANYPAANNVRLAGHKLVFDRQMDYWAGMSAKTQLVVQAGGTDAVHIERLNPTMPAYTYFAITSILRDSATDTVTMTYTHDITGFTLEGMRVLVSDDLAGPWFSLPEEDYTATVDTVTVPNWTGNVGFFKLVYQGAYTDAVRVTLRGSVVVKDALILRGTDSKYYRITVSGGTLTATEVTL